VERLMGKWTRPVTGYALERAVWSRQRAGVDVSALVHHADWPGQTSQRHTDLLAANDVVTSVGSRADS
jgi:putative transposase